jgi:hypothetical protein
MLKYAGGAEEGVSELLRELMHAQLTYADECRRMLTYADVC